MTTIELVAASAAAAAGAVVQGSVGFGLSLVAVPVLLLIDPRLVPGPVLCVAIVLTLLIARRERRSIDLFGVTWGLAGRLPGTALGAAALVVMPRDRMSLAFGVLVLLAVAMSASKLRIRPTPLTLVSAGMLSGIMATTAAIGGPPIALVLQHSPGAQLRGTLSGFFLVGASVSLLALVAVDRFGREELLLSAALLPGILLGYMISGRTAPWLDRGYTRVAVLAVATVAAIVVIVRQLW
ncbi:MAG: hypothetical protein AMS25_02625 [Gemmatimonas sp. SM23_52]|nr:MAG: hypothetical protein AMS25_02625 [Gemmatimonas sp. SM23_52]